MGPTKTRTVKNKHAAPKSGAGGASGGSDKKRSSTDGVSKSRGKPKGPIVSKQIKDNSILDKMKKNKKKTWTAEQLGVPMLNTITPIGVTKPRGKKKGKVFVDDRESMNTIMSMVQAEKDGQIESKMIKARQMEEIREARKVEAEKKEQQRRDKIEDAKEGLRKKRKRTGKGATADEDGDTIKSVASGGTKSKKKVAFA